MSAPVALPGPVPRFRCRPLLLLFAALAGGLHCGDGVTVPSDGLPSDITVLAGNGQSGVVGQQLSDSLVIRLTDSQDRPVQGQKIVFDVIVGGATADLVPDTVVTDDNGIARSVWVLGGLAGEQRVEARVVAHGSLSAEFTAMASAEGPDTVFAAGGQDQTGIVNGLLADSLVVVVADRFGNPLAGQDVEWRVPVNQGTISATATITGADGRAAVARILGPNAGAQSTRASVGSLAGQVVLFRHTAISGHAVDLVRLSLDNQTAPAGSRLADPLVVQAQDADGNGVPGEVITWVPSAGGSVDPRSSTTDAEGKAFTFWTLSPQAGANTLTAAGFGTSIQYHATGASSDPDTLRALSPTSFTAPAGQPVPAGQRPSVRVSDTKGNPVPGVSVSFSVTQGGGTISDANGSGSTVAIPTGADGVATLAGWTLGAAPGANVVTAQAARPGGGALNGSPVSFTATGGGGSTTTITSDDPDPSAVGQPYTVAFTVSAGSGTPSGSVTVSDGAASCSGTLSAGAGSCALTSTTAGGKTLTATYAGDNTFAGSSDTEPHTVSGAPPVLHLAFTVQPSDVNRGEEIRPKVEVSILDQNNMVVKDATNPISVVLGNNLLGLATLHGTLTRTPLDGVAEFDDLTVTGLTLLSNLTLIASTPGLTQVESTTFNVR